MCYRLYNTATSTYLHGEPPEATVRELIFIGIPPAEEIERGPILEWDRYSDAWMAKAMLEARGVVGFHVCAVGADPCRVNVLKDNPIRTDLDFTSAPRVRLHDIPT